MLPEQLENAWAIFAGAAGGVALLATFLANLGKLRRWIRARLDARKERRSAPVKTLALVTRMQEQVDAIDRRLQRVEAENRSQSDKLDALDADTADLLSSQLTREHDYFVKKGFCPTLDKERIGKIYERYKHRGRNHIADSLMDDLLALPSFDPGPGGGGPA